MSGADVFGLVGQTLQGCRVERAVGEGGFAVVYKAHHVTFNEPRALKCLKIPPHFTPEARRVFLSRFREEAQLLRRLGQKSPNIVQVLDFGIKDEGSAAEIPYLILEWLEGRTLSEEITRRRSKGLPLFGEKQAIELLAPVLEALEVAHGGTIGEKVAHRDIKPDNIFVLAGDAWPPPLKVLDFGIAKVMQEGESSTQRSTRTSSGFRAFTPVYGAPEQFFDNGKKYGPTGPWTDVHAIGLILVVTPSTAST